MSAASERCPVPHSGKRLTLIAVLVASIMVAGFTIQTNRAVARTNACNGLSILVAHADSPPNRLRTELLAEPGVSTVDLFNGSSGTPTVAQMAAYDMVSTISDGTWANPAAVGNNLADYLDQNGTVVALNFTFLDSATVGVQGRYKIDGYSPFNYNNALDFSDATLGAHNAGHPLMRGVTALGAFYRHDVTLAAGASQVAAWTDGSPLVAHKGRVVGINFHPQEGEPASWTGQFAKAITNAGKWKSVGCPTKTTLKVGKSSTKVTAKGKVSPNHAGQRTTVTLQRKAGGQFKKVATKKPRLNANSKYTAGFDRPRPGNCRFKVRFGGHGAHLPKHLPSGATKTFAC